MKIKEQPQLEETQNPLDQYRVGADETALAANIPCQINYENITIAPGERENPVSILMDKNCE